jgi:hypothetical protein
LLEALLLRTARSRGEHEELPRPGGGGEASGLRIGCDEQCLEPAHERRVQRLRGDDGRNAARGEEPARLGARGIGADPVDGIGEDDQAGADVVEPGRLGGGEHRDDGKSGARLGADREHRPGGLHREHRVSQARERSGQQPRPCAEIHHRADRGGELGEADDQRLRVRRPGAVVVGEALEDARRTGRPVHGAGVLP